MASPAPRSEMCAPRRRWMATLAAATVLVAAASCGDGGEGADPAATSSTEPAAETTDDPTTEATTTSTNTTPASGELDDLVSGLGDAVESCCEPATDATGESVSFKLAGGADASLSREPINANRPADARRGLSGARYITSPDGGAALVADGDPFSVRFDCAGITYTLVMGGA